jgi:hypothetical protein
MTTIKGNNNRFFYLPFFVLNIIKVVDYQYINKQRYAILRNAAPVKPMRIITFTSIIIG